MKRFWKILNNFDIENCMRYLDVKSNYIEILLEEDSVFMRYLEKRPMYVYICQSDDDHNYFENSNDFGGFGWGEESHFDFFISENYEFCGTIDLRKEKLKKLSGKFRENI